MFRTSLGLALVAAVSFGGVASAHNGATSDPIDLSDVYFDLRDNVWLGAHDDHVGHDFAASSRAHFDVRDNDVVTEIDPRRVDVIIGQAPESGSVFINQDGTVTYRADDSLRFTSDSFTYYLDFQGKTSQVATVFIEAQ